MNTDSHDMEGPKERGSWALMAVMDCSNSFLKLLWENALGVMQIVSNESIATVRNLLHFMAMRFLGFRNDVSLFCVEQNERSPIDWGAPLSAFGLFERALGIEQ